MHGIENKKIAINCVIRLKKKPPLIQTILLGTLGEGIQNYKNILAVY